MENSFYDFVMDDIARMTECSREDVEKDFAMFNAEIDRIMAEEGVDEDTAISKVYGTWNFPLLAI